MSPESVAAYGEAAPDAKQPFEMPTGIVPGVGGLRVELSSTALVGLDEGARYVVEYPYGCVGAARVACVRAWRLASDLGDAFRLPGIDAQGSSRDGRRRRSASSEAYQCLVRRIRVLAGRMPDRCRRILTSYVLDVYQTAASLKYQVDADVMDRALRLSAERSAERAADQ